MIEILRFWPVVGIVIAITFAIYKGRDENIVLRFIYVCLGFLAGIVLGPFAIGLFFEGKKS